MNRKLSPMIKMHKFMFLMQKMLDKELLSKFDVTFSQCRILAAVSYHSGISQKQIADFEELTEAAVSRHINILKKKGYITLVANSKNKKEHILHLTLGGKLLVKQCLKVLETKGETILGALSTIQKQTLSESGDYFPLASKSLVFQSQLFPQNNH